MTATNVLGSSTESMGITVTAASVVDFTSDTQSGNAPLTVTFSDASSPGGTAYDWSFGAGEGTGTGATASHTYSTPGTYTVGLTVTYPVLGPITTTKTNYISVSVGLCTVPSLNGVKRNSAQAVWTGAAFTGTVSDGPGAPNGNYTILSQSITAASSVPCSSSITVNNP
jgi:PKD repeat protein